MSAPTLCLTPARRLATVLTASTSALAPTACGVIDGVDGGGRSASPKKVDIILVDALDAGIPVIAYDRLAQGPIAAYVSHDNELVGEVQGRDIQFDAPTQDAVDSPTEKRSAPRSTRRPASRSA